MYKYLLIIVFSIFNFSFNANINEKESFSKNCDIIERVSTAEFESYIQTDLRQTLMSSDNDGTKNPRKDDAGNWTGCTRGSGKLVGTYRDVSACAYKAYFGKEPTVEDLRNMTYEDAKEVYYWFWSELKIGEIYDQDLANLVMHIKLHYGNVYVVQKSLNKLGYKLKVDGQMGEKTLSVLIELSIQKPNETYKTIRNQLLEKYKKANPVYRKGFIRFLNEHFPEK